jgi:hypothetical protein
VADCRQRFFQETSGGLTQCGWTVYEFAAPAGVPGFNSLYGFDLLTNLGSDLASLGGNSVMTSLDEWTESGLAVDFFAYLVETDPTVSNGFTLEHAQATDATRATTVSAMAAKGVVVTAVSANSSGRIDLVSFLLLHLPLESHKRGSSRLLAVP